MAKGFEKFVDLTQEIIAACYEVHRIIGPGLEERFYRNALIEELALRGIKAVSEQVFPVYYKGKFIGKHQVDVIVEDKVSVEVKALTGQLPNVHIAQTISEMNVCKLPVALLVNFGDTSVQVRRFENRDQSVNP